MDHVTSLESSEDYTSQRDLESNEIQHVILKTFRDERQLATKSTNAERSSRSCSGSRTRF